MYRDIGGQYGVLFYYIMAAFIKLFGEYLWAINVATSCVYAVCYSLLFLCACRFMNEWQSFVISLLTLAMAPFFICLFQPWSSVYALMFLLLSTYLFFRYMQHGKGFLLVLCSFSTIACFLCRQPVGIVLFLSFVLFFVFAVPLRLYVPHYKKSILCYFSAFVVSGGGLVAYLVFKGTFIEFLRLNFVNTYQFAMARTNAANPLSTILDCLFVHTYLLQSEEKIFITWRLLPLSSIAAFVVIAIRKLMAKGNKGDVEKERILSMLFALSIICIASWHQYYPVTCVRHVFWAAFPMPILLFYGLLAVSLRTCKKAWPAWLLFVLILSPVLWSRMLGGLKKATAPYVFADTTNFDFMEKLRLTEDQKAYYDEVSAAVAEAREKYGADLMVVDSRWYGYLYYLSYNDRLLRGNDDFIVLVADDTVLELYKAQGYNVTRRITDTRYSKDPADVTYVVVKH
ncbi:MAG: glycosyltransferase family 39 protein [Treponema sp.]|nr:glycosyltransferase family 39 protein [Treponema sp.]